MEELVDAIAELSNAVDTTSGWEIAGVILSAFTLLGSFFVLYQNHRTIDLSRREIQNTINLQLFDKMIGVANKIEKDDYSSTKMEIYT